MASTYVPNPESLTPQIKDLQSQVSQHQKALDTSVTGSSSVLEPTSKDIGNELAIRDATAQLRTLKKKQLSSAWYGDPEQEAAQGDQGASAGIVGKTLNTLSLPLRGIVAGTRSLLGDAPNPKMEETFSDLLKEHNVPYPIAAPLGFAMDVALDPVNWLTAGTGALIPRVAMGLTKGGVAGAARGLESSLLEKGAWMARKTPGISNDFAEGVSQKANQAWESYKSLTSHDPLEKIHMAGADIPFVNQRYNLADVAKGVFSYVPGGEGMYNALHYSSRDWMDQQRLLDSVEKASAKTLAAAKAPSPEAAALSNVDVPAGPNQLGSPMIKPNMELLKNVPAGGEKDALIDTFTKVADDAAFLDANPGRALSANPEDNAWRILQEAQTTDTMRDTMMKLRDEYQSVDATGIGWYDKSIDWAKGVKVKMGDKEVRPIKEFLDGYNSLIQGVFKPAHTILSPTTWAMNALGAPTMYAMMGGEHVGKMMKYYKDVYLAQSGLDARSFILDSGFLDPHWIDAMTKNPGVTRKTFGVGPAYFLGKGYVDKMVQMGREQGLWNATNEAEALKEVQKFSDEIRKQLQTATEQSQKSTLSGLISKTIRPGAKKAAEEDLGKGMNQSSMIDELRAQLGRGGIPSQADLPAGFTVRDPQVRAELLDKIEQFVEAKAAEGNVAAKAYKGMMDWARAGYERQDQAMRMSIAMTLTKEGLSENGIKVISRFSPFNRETDLLNKYVRDGKTFYRIAPMKAMDIANDAAINYGAMPAAIRMLRSMPILGAPFGAFSYGMGLRTAQTLAYNPALFNKINYGINAFSGDKTPLERKALNPGPGQPNYYGWYNEPSMMRLPVNFFSNYPLYMNLTNVLPYYSLNMAQPANRTYSDVLPDTIVQVLDRSPMLKDPVGSSLFDFFILPALLANSGAKAESALGAPIFPSTASDVEKAGYFGRNLVDAFTPGVVAPVGLAAPTEESVGLLPGYRTRQLGYGRFGENALGIPGSEDPASRTIRNLLGYMGVPVQRLDTSFAASEAKNKP